MVSLILCNSENTFNTKIRINAEYVIVTKSKNVSPKNEKVNIIINEPIFIFFNYDKLFIYNFFNNTLEYTSP